MLNEILTQRNAFRLRLIVGVVTGIISAQQFTFLPSLTVIGSGLFVATLFWLLRMRLCSSFLIGLCWALAFACFRLQDSLSPELERHDFLVQGEVSDLPVRFEEGVRFIFNPDTVIEPQRIKLPSQLRISWYEKDAQVRSGEHWRLRLRLKRPHGNFPFREAWTMSSGCFYKMRATGYVLEDNRNRKPTVAFMVGAGNTAIAI